MRKSKASAIGKALSDLRMVRMTAERRREVATIASRAAAEARSRRAAERRAAAEAAGDSA